MLRKKYNPNIYRALTTDIKEKLRVAVLEAIFRVLREQRRKTHPPMELLVEFVSEEVRRVVERLHHGLAKRHIETQYFIVYKGSKSRKAVKLVQVAAEDIVALKKLMLLHKPSWASQGRAYALVYPLPDDECFPCICFWPQVKPYK